MRLKFKFKIKIMNNEQQSSSAENNCDNFINFDESERTFNPSPTDELEADLEKIRGDAIGDTLYSSRFVLSTLMKLTNYEQRLSDDESFEKDLCYLWDMTIEKDVILLLLQHDVLELFSEIIERSDDERLVEILVGIIGNMCSLEQTRDKMCNSAEIMTPILELIGCIDSLVLVQLMRLLHATLVFENAGDEIVWFQHFCKIDNFVGKFAAILLNSTSTTLLISAYEALNSICNKFAVIEILEDVCDTSFCDVFIKPVLIGAVIDAFEQMIPDAIGDQPVDDTSTPSTRTQKIMTLFLEINDTLAQHETVSQDVYRPYLGKFLKCVSKILAPLCQPVALFPITVTEQGYLETINELFHCLNDPFDGVCFNQLTRIFSAIAERIENRSKSNEEQNGDGFDDEVDTKLEEDMKNSVLDMITRMCREGPETGICEAVRTLNSLSIERLYRAMREQQNNAATSDCCTKLCNVAIEIWNLNLETGAQVNESS